MQRCRRPQGHARRPELIARFSDRPPVRIPERGAVAQGNEPYLNPPLISSSTRKNGLLNRDFYIITVWHCCKVNLSTVAEPFRGNGKNRYRS